jgi:hypothetical protein
MKGEEKCGARFEDHVCQRLKDHAGKHLDNREGCWHSWTDAVGRAAAEKDSKDQTAPGLASGSRAQQFHSETKGKSQKGGEAANVAGNT